MTQKSVIDEAAIVPGWNDDTKLILACEFIDNLNGADKFQLFLEERAGLEAQQAAECEDE